MLKIFYDFSENKAYYIIIFVSVLLGAIIRLNGLGLWSLALDEYYVVASSENILKYGLPQFPNGGYYSRGVLLQYLISSLLSIGIKAEFAGRIFSVISSLITIPPIYLIAKKIGNIKIATLAVIVFSFSIWHIEFARFARMYAPFQALFMWYIYFALLDFNDKNFNSYNRLLILSFVSLFTYEGSIFLAVFNFIPFILYKRLNLKYFGFAILIFIFSGFINTFSFRRFSSNPIFPLEYLEMTASNLSSFPIRFPKILLPFAFENIFSIITTILLIVVNVILLYNIYKYIGSKNFWNILSLIILGICALCNQFGLFILSTIALVFWKLFEANFTNKRILFLFALLFIVNIIYWYIYGITSDNWYVLFNDFSSYKIWGISKRLIVGFFNYPDNYYSLLNYFHTLPLLMLFSGILILFLIGKNLFSKNKIDNNVQFLLSSLSFFAIISTIPPLLYDETRYTFFAVPLLIILVIYSAYIISTSLVRNKRISTIIFSFTIITVFYFSKDFNIYHILNIDSASVNYRMIYESNYVKKHLYRRWDIKTPTDYVKDNLHKNDIIIINENSIEYYLPKVDYFNFNYRHRAFPAITVESGTKERWSNARLIYTNEDLINFIDSRKTRIWFIVYPENWLTEIDFYEKYKNNIVYTGIDGMIKVFEFPKKVHTEY